MMNDGSRNRRILVVDDYEEIHKDFRLILTQAVRTEAGLDEDEAMLFEPTKKKQSV